MMSVVIQETSDNLPDPAKMWPECPNAKHEISIWEGVFRLHRSEYPDEALILPWFSASFDQREGNNLWLTSSSRHWQKLWVSLRLELALRQATKLLKNEWRLRKFSLHLTALPWHLFVYEAWLGTSHSQFQAYWTKISDVSQSRSQAVELICPEGAELILIVQSEYIYFYMYLGRSWLIKEGASA